MTSGTLMKVKSKLDKVKGLEYLPRIGVRIVHIITPNERELMTTLSCSNAPSDCLPNHNVFKANNIKQYTFQNVKMGLKWECMNTFG